MAFHDDKHVISMEGVVIWEAITKPDDLDDGGKSFNLRVAVDPNAPEIAELQQLVQQALRDSTKKNVNPQNPGNNPIGPIDAAKFPELPGRVCFSAGTRLGAPPVYDVNGAELQPMQYGPQLYNGTVVKLLVHAYAYENKQKGINFGLDGVQIIDGKAPRLSIGAAGLSKAVVASAFGGAAKPSIPAASAAPAVPGAATPPPAVPYTGYAEAPAVPGVPSAPVWPPEGWAQHPQSPTHWYKGQEVITEAELRARVGA